MNVVVLSPRTSAFKDPAAAQDDKYVIRNTESQIAALIIALREAGHKVTVEPLIPGERHNYDCALVELSNPLAWGSRYLYSALWAIASTPSITAYTHWDPVKLFGGFRAIAKDPEKRLFDGPVKFYMREAALNVKERIIQAAIDINSGRGPNQIISAFPWGNHGLLLENTPVTEWAWVYDPSAFMPDPPWSKPSERERAWVFATFTDSREWLASLGIGWTIHEYGRNIYGRKWGGFPEIFQKMHDCWGSIVHKYPFSGAGYWRPRYVHAAKARNLVLQSWEDAHCMGMPFRVNAPAMEKLNDVQLLELAREQSRWFFDHSWTRGRFVDEIAKFVKAAVG